MVFEKINSVESIQDFRNLYLDGLIEAQELFLELKLKCSEIFIIKSGDRRIGYFILDNDYVLWEYYIIRGYINQADTIFGEIIENFSIKKTLCKSFDHVLLSCCVRYQSSIKEFGIHFRHYEKNWVLQEDENIIARFPVPEDEETIKAVNEDIFESDEEIRYYIENRKMFIFEKDCEMIGFGVFSRVINNRPEFDIGMCVNRKFRKRGYGTFILKYLIEYCERNGWRPIAGCASGNYGSRRCLENAGFIAGYRLLEFSF